jgi:hypothetical protein
VSVLVGLLASSDAWAMSEGPWPMSEGSWIWLMARCWWPSWIQRALQLMQMAIGYRPKVMVTRADRHNGQRGMTTSLTSLTSLIVSLLRLAVVTDEPPGARLESVLKAASVAGSSTADEAEVAGRAGLVGAGTDGTEQPRDRFSGSAPHP